MFRPKSKTWDSSVGKPSFDSIVVKPARRISNKKNRRKSIGKLQNVGTSSLVPIRSALVDAG